MIEHTKLLIYLLLVSSISATATLGSPRVIPRSIAAGSSDKVRLKNSEPSLAQSGLTVSNTVLSTSPRLNVTIL